MDGIIFHSKALSVPYPSHSALPASLHSLHLPVRYCIKFFITLSYLSTDSPLTVRLAVVRVVVGVILSCHPIDQFAIHQYAIHLPVLPFPRVQYYFCMHNIEEKSPQGFPSASFILPCCCLPVMPCSSRLDYL